MTSWGYPKACANYHNPDQFFVTFGRRPTEPERTLPKFLYVSEDRGVHFKRVANLDEPVYSMNVSRTEEQRLTVFTPKSIMSTTNFGKTWEKYNYTKDFRAAGGSRKVSGVVNPDNPDEVWVGGRDGTVIASKNGGKSWSNISGKLPKGQVSELVYHEGSKGDLYALVNGFGVFYKAAGKKEWQLWMDGFNLKDCREIRVDYQHQKLVAASYGRGAWEALLMNPCERFYKKGFKIKQLNAINGVKVFAIDSPLATPDYYHYQWYCNNKRVGQNSPILLWSKTKSGDRIGLKIIPKRFTKFSTTSRLIRVKTRRKSLNKVEKEGLEFKNNYVDLGNIELFGARKDFTFETTVKLNNAGVIAGNRRHFFRDAKGWYMDVDKQGTVSLYLSARQNCSLMRTFKQPKEQALILRSEKNELKFDKWTQLAFSIDNKGSASLYIDGKEVASDKIAPASIHYSLNSVFSTTLLADPMGMKRCSGKVKNVRIWNKVLRSSQLMSNRSRLISTSALVYYINFGAKVVEEQFSRKAVVIKNGHSDI
ncbi:MAG: hypothetical protein HRT88_04175 [Lentisphaeraceae bacterium]|nr:hypothetical protein [Lentisphaeraceae bacterium]